jgi:3'-5' exoribonuclease 1
MTIPTSFMKELQGSNLFLLVDLEATCWERRKVRDKNEIIELGACMCDIDGNILGQFQSFVRPRINIKLSGFCKKLTGISQQDVEPAPILSEAISNLHDWADSQFSADLKLIRWASWGNWDNGCIQRDCERHKIDFPFSDHICLKNLYKELRGVEVGLKEAVRREGFEWEGSEHRALDDAYNSHKVARVLLVEHPAIEQETESD